jgi:hypothetical protein
MTVTITAKTRARVAGARAVRHVGGDDQRVVGPEHAVAVRQRERHLAADQVGQLLLVVRVQREAAAGSEPVARARHALAVDDLALDQVVEALPRQGREQAHASPS